MSFPCETGCPRQATVRLGARVFWYVCAPCAESRRFRRHRVARVLATHDLLRRDSAGWWIDSEGTLVPPAPLAEVLARLALPPCPGHGWRPVRHFGDSGRQFYECPDPGCLVSGWAAEDEAGAAEGWRVALGVAP